MGTTITLERTVDAETSQTGQDITRFALSAADVVETLLRTDVVLDQHVPHRPCDTVMLQ